VCCGLLITLSVTHEFVSTHVTLTAQPRPTKSSLHTLCVMTETEIFLHTNVENRKQYKLLKVVLPILYKNTSNCFYLLKL
jgi:hypothetical protein